MTWTNFSFSVGQVLSAANMNNLYANFGAMAAGDSGAPSIVEAALDAAVTAQLVTNGDSHNHSGGDGAAIPEASITWSTRKVVSSDLDISSASLTDVTGLTGFSLTAGKHYAIRGCLKVANAAAPSVQRASVALTFTNAPQEFNMGVLGFYDPTQYNEQTSSGTATTAVTGAAASGAGDPVQLLGIIQANGTTGGTVKLQAKTNDSSFHTYIDDGSWLEIIQLD